MGRILLELSYLKGERLNHTQIVQIKLAQFFLVSISNHQKHSKIKGKANTISGQDFWPLFLSLYCNFHSLIVGISVKPYTVG